MENLSEINKNQGGEDFEEIKAKESGWSKW